MHIPFTVPDITEAEIEEVVKVMKSGWITTGPKTKELERTIASFVGVNKAVCLNSATASMEMTLRMLGIGPGDEVITTAYTYTATASVIHHVGATIVLVDTAPDSYEIDSKALETAITDKTKAIIPVDIAGVMCDYEAIFAVVEQKRHLFQASSELQRKFNRIIVMADAAHALGAKRKGQQAGQVADFSCFSFHAVKNLTTAEGGAVVWRSREDLDDEWLYEQFMLSSLHGQSKDALTKTQKGSWEYDIVYPAYKCNMTDMAAAIGLAQLTRYAETLQKRKAVINQYDEVLLPAGVEALSHDGTDHASSGHLYLARVPGVTEIERNTMIEKMAEAGISCNVHYKPLPLLSAYQQLGFDIEDYPNAWKMYENTISLPLYTTLTQEGAKHVAEQLIRAIAVVKE